MGPLISLVRGGPFSGIACSSRPDHGRITGNNSGDSAGISGKGPAGQQGTVELVKKSQINHFQCLPSKRAC